MHDLVDFVFLEAEKLADAAAAYLEGKITERGGLKICCNPLIHHTVPQLFSGSEPFDLSLRVVRPMEEITITARQGGKIVGEKKMHKALPAEMITLRVTPVSRMELEVGIA